jgi:hypothetical protein
MWEARVSEKGSHRGSRVCSYRARRGEGVMAGSNGHQWPRGPAASRHSRGGNLNGDETEEIDGGE